MTSSPTPKRARLRFWLSFLHVVAMGFAGSLTVGLLIALIVSGFSSLFAAGLGVIALVGAVYALWGVAWFENERVSGLYDLPIGRLPFPKSEKQGFVGWLHSLWLIIRTGRMWAVLGSFTLTSLLGGLVLWAVSASAGVALNAVVALATAGDGQLLFTDDFAIPLAITELVGGLLIAIVLIVGSALLHRAMTVAIVESSSRQTALAEQVRQSARQREGAVRSAEMERTRIERDLHDGVQPRLVSIGMTLGLAQQQLQEDPEEAKQLMAEAHTSTQAAITELRQLSRGIHASVLSDRGLDAALSAVAARSHVPVHLDVRIGEKRCPQAETAVYFAISEALTNAAKHSRASQCRVVVRLRDNNTLWARVEDDGVGRAQVVPGGGLDGITQRVTAVGGTLSIDSPAGGPTTIEMSVPCVS
jgi:signal transduction histidine kinase